ncbi:hypothetical protein ACFWBG_11465 [Nocardia salmonicida]|uniref:hypothetical protein n=1 Tax=Nocardia salmonicida TaxID=53431 RepID=UPI003672163D
MLLDAAGHAGSEVDESRLATAEAAEFFEAAQGSPVANPRDRHRAAVDLGSVGFDRGRQIGTAKQIGESE